MIQKLATLLLLLIFLGAGFGVAQNKEEIQVTGKLINADDNSPVDFATVSFLTANDSTFVLGDITDVTGEFSVRLKPGEYIVKAQFLAFETAYKKIQLPSNTRRKNIGEIRMHEDVEQLLEVVVRGEKTQMEMTLDKRVYNIGQDLVNRGGDASQILDNLPSISVDMDGNVSLRGSSSVKILINGKPSGLVGIGGTDALRQLDANLIERVEVITNPSARYEAEGMAGIINIVLKKEQRSGINGSFNLKTGIPEDHGAALNLNYRKNWFNLFTNYSFTYRDSPRKGSSFQQFSYYITEINRESNRSGFSNSIRVGGDIYLDDKNIITASAIYRLSDEKPLSSINYVDRALDRTLISRTNRLNEEAEDEHVLEYSINFTRNFGAPNHKFTFDIQYRRNEEVEDADIQEVTVMADSPTRTKFQGSLNNEFQRDYLLQADYVKPLGEKHKFETGWRSSIRKIDNSYMVEEQAESGLWSPLPQFTNDFVYDETIHSLYALYGTEINKFSVQGGVRAEYSDIRTLLEQTTNRNHNQYLNVFPSIHLTYSFNTENSMQLSYGKRFNRPGFWSLNPFTTFSDSRNIRSGNPNLKPEFTDSYELGYLRTWPKGTFYFGSYYRYTVDKFERIQTLEDSILFTYPINLSTENAYGLEANFSREFFGKLNLDGNANFYQAVSKGEWQGVNLNSETLTMSGRLNTQLKLLDDYNIQLNSFYRAPHTTTQGKIKSMYSIDFGVSKDVFSNKGTIVLNMRNILNSLRWRSETFGEGFYSQSDFRWRPRQVTLSFVYRINTTKEQTRQRTGGSGGEDFDGDF